MALELDDTQAAVLLALLGLPEDATDVLDGARRR